MYSANVPFLLLNDNSHIASAAGDDFDGKIHVARAVKIHHLDLRDLSHLEGHAAIT